MALDFHLHQLFPEMSHPANSDLTSEHTMCCCLEEVMPVRASFQMVCDLRKLREMAEVV